MDLLRHLRVTYGAAFDEQVAAALRVERDEARKSLAEERTTLIDETMLAGEQLDFPAIATEDFDLAPTVFCWSAFCGSASIEQLHQARDAAYLIHQDTRSVIKVVRYGLNIQCYPDAHAVELCERVIARQREHPRELKRPFWAD